MTKIETEAKAREWLQRLPGCLAARVRFVGMLVEDRGQPLPDDTTIGEYWAGREEEVDRMFAEACEAEGVSTNEVTALSTDPTGIRETARQAAQLLGVTPAGMRHIEGWLKDL